MWRPVTLGNALLLASTGNALYTSPTVQNELIMLIGEDIQK